MDDGMIQEHLRNIDRRLSNVEQILPTLATQEHLRNIDQRLSKVEQLLPTLATKDDLERYATKEDLERYATKEDLAAATALLATKEEVQLEGERSRRHMDVIAESLRSDIQLLAEHVAAVMSRRSDR